MEGMPLNEMSAGRRRPDESSAGHRRPAWLVVLLCWILVVFDGYDLIVYGTTLPHLQAEWGLSAGAAGFVGSLAFAGMMVGALVAGYLADHLGRRNTILVCTALFSVFTAACAFATDQTMFGAFRFIAGIGLGGLVPSANALTAEFVRPRFRSAVSTIMMSGVPIGGSIAAVIGIFLLPKQPTAGTWHEMYLIGFAAVAVIIICLFALPESPSWLRSKGRVAAAERVEAIYGIRFTDEASVVAEQSEVNKQGGPFHQPWLLPTILFSAATLTTLFAWYGLGTWLPKLMASDARFDMGNPLGFLLALNLGAVVGSALTAWAGVRFGPVRSAVVAALAAGLGLAFLLTYPGSLAPIYAALIFAGIGTHGTQCLIIAAITTHYPARLRGAALGLALGIGRIGAVAAPQVGGWLLDWTTSPTSPRGNVGSNFAAFAIAAGISAILLAIIAVTVKHRQVTQSPAPVISETSS